MVQYVPGPFSSPQRAWVYMRLVATRPFSFPIHLDDNTVCNLPSVGIAFLIKSLSSHHNQCHCNTFFQQTCLHSLQDKINVISQRTNLALYPDPLVHTVRACAKFTEIFLVQFTVYYHYHVVRHVQTRYTKHPKSVKSRHVLLVASFFKLFFCRYCSLTLYDR